MKKTFTLIAAFAIAALSLTQNGLNRIVGQRQFVSHEKTLRMVEVLMVETQHEAIDIVGRDLPPIGSSGILSYIERATHSQKISYI